MLSTLKFREMSCIIGGSYALRTGQSRGSRVLAALARPSELPSTRTTSSDYSSTSRGERHLSSSGSETAVLTAPELYRAARLARLSGLTYYSPEGLEQGCRELGLRLVAEGSNSFTRWFVAEGQLFVPRKGQVEASAPTERFVLLRGVKWGSVNSTEIWQRLVRFWPAPFEPRESPVLVLAGLDRSTLVVSVDTGGF